jgi:hypothetical protein
MVLCSLLFKGYHQHHNYVVFLFVPINFMVRLSCLCLTNENQINYYDGIEERISDDHIRSFFVFLVWWYVLFFQIRFVLFIDDLIVRTLSFSRLYRENKTLKVISSMMFNERRFFFSYELDMFFFEIYIAMIIFNEENNYIIWIQNNVFEG